MFSAAGPRVVGVAWVSVVVGVGLYFFAFFDESGAGDFEGAVEDGAVSGGGWESDFAVDDRVE